MKKLILSITVLAFSAVLFAQTTTTTDVAKTTTTDVAKKTVADVAKFEKDVIDQGKLKQNDPKEVRFVVTNITKEPIIIEQANPTCGCTIGDWTKEPIAAGKNGFISAKFNAAGVGHFEKHLSVKFAGIDEIKSITIQGDVLSPEDYDKWIAANPVKVEVATPAATPTKSKDKKTKTTASPTLTPAKGS